MYQRISPGGMLMILNNEIPYNMIKKTLLVITAAAVLICPLGGCTTQNEIQPIQEESDKSSSSVKSAVDFEHELDDYAPKKNNYNLK